METSRFLTEARRRAKILSDRPGLPTQVYQVPQPASSLYPYDYPYPIDYAYPEFFPYWLGAPWYFGLAPSIVVVQRFHHFHCGFPAASRTVSARGFGPSFGIARAAREGADGASKGGARLWACKPSVSRYDGKRICAS